MTKAKIAESQIITNSPGTRKPKDIERAALVLIINKLIRYFNF